MVDTSKVRWTGGLASNMWQVVVRIFVLGSFAFIALVMVSSQMAAAQTTGESGGFSGVLWEDLDEDNERDSSEEALAGMIVVLYSIDPPGDDEVDRAVTGLDGRYTFTSLPGGRYDVRVEISSGTSAGTVSGAGVEGRWLSELTTEDWNLGLIRHDPALPPRSDPVPPPQVSVEAIAVERPAASTPTSESVPTDDDPSERTEELAVLGTVELNEANEELLAADQDSATSIAPPPRLDPTTTAAQTAEVAAATTFIPSPSTEPPVAAARVETSEAPRTSPAEARSSTLPTSTTSVPTPTTSPSAAATAPSTRAPDVAGEVAFEPVGGVGDSVGALDDRAMTLLTSAALAMTGMALLTGARRRRQDLRP